MFNILALSMADQSSRTKMIWGIIILVLFIFVVLGVIGMLITRLMKWQGKAVDRLMYKVTITKVIQNKKHFRKIALIKSNRYFFRQVWFPLVIMLVSAAFILLYCTISGSWGINILSDYGSGLDKTAGVNSNSGGTGLATIFYLWDFTTIVTTPPSGSGVIVDWPQVLNVPYFSAVAWQSYVFFALFTPGAIWFLVVVQCYISRLMRIFSLGNKIYDKNLETFRYDDTFKNSKNINLETLVEESEKQEKPMN